MESANFHLHQQEDHHLVTSSFSWSQNPILNGTNNIINSRNLDAGTNSSVQDFRFPYNSMGYPIENIVSHELQCRSRIKDEFSVAESYPKFLELLNGSPTSNTEDVHLHPYPVADSYSKFIELLKDSPTSNTEDIHLHPYSTNLNSNDHQQISYSNRSNGTLSQIFPTISVPSLNKCTTTTSSSSSSSSSSSVVSSTSFDMNCLPPLNLFGSPRFDHGNLNYHASLNTHNHGDISYGFNRILQPNQRPSACPNKMTRVSTTERIDQSAKRPASKLYVDTTKETQSVAPKKSKSEPRSSSAPFQVRKEKLGDKIAAIQLLVAPFGKTDTASVLMEAIGYIKFLQTQVETLSVPYMKSTTNKIGGISSQRGRMEDGDITEVKRDLRSRGLCLVPLSSLSYVTDGCEDMWPHHNHLT